MKLINIRHYNYITIIITIIILLYYTFRLKAVFQLRVFYTYVHACRSLNHFNITFEVSKCFDGENSSLYLRFSML